MRIQCGLSQSTSFGQATAPCGRRPGAARLDDSENHAGQGGAEPLGHLCHVFLFDGQKVTRAPSWIVLGVADVNLPKEPELILIVSPARFVWLKALRKSARKRNRTLSVISIDFTTEAFTFHTFGK